MSESALPDSAAADGEVQRDHDAGAEATSRSRGQDGATVGLKGLP
jgi:hypothetical protein